MPQTGQVRLWSFPERINSPERAGIRIDHGIQTGQEVSPFYDPMIAKVIAYGDNRAEAIRRLASAVQDTQLLGMNNNKLFLQNVLRHKVFGAGEATTAFIEQHFSRDASVDQKQPSAATLAKAAMLYFQRGIEIGQDKNFHWSRATAQSYVYKLEFDGQSNVVKLTEREHHFEIEAELVVGEADAEKVNTVLEFVSLDESTCVFIENGVRETLSFAFDGKTLYLDDGTGHFILEDVTHQPAAAAGGAGSGQVKASMDGAIVEVLVKEGDSVEVGQTLVVLEAMKMEHPLKAGISGTVTAISCEAGQQVKSKQLLVSVEGESGDE